MVDPLDVGGNNTGCRSRSTWLAQMPALCHRCGYPIDPADADLPGEVVCPACGSSLRRDPAETRPWSVSEPAGHVAPLMPGQVVSHYRVLERLGRGGMGIVYKAQDNRLGRSVALKFLTARCSQDPEILKRFEHEARAASELNHPHICTAHDVGEHEGQPYIVMELLEGRTLQQYIDRKPLALPELLELGLQIADALEAAHDKGIIHRDIKPANIYVSQRGLVKVLDFGLAKRGPEQVDIYVADTEINPAPVNDLLSWPGTVVGTKAYMSPEQSRGEELDRRSDLYSFGVVLFEMATGRLPLTDSTDTVVSAALAPQLPEPR